MNKRIVKTPITAAMNGDRPRPSVSHSHQNGSKDPVHYGSSELPQEVLKSTEQKIEVPEKDKGYIRAAAITGGGGGESDIRDFFARQFNSCNAELDEACRRLIDILAGETAGAGRNIRELSSVLGATDRYLESIGASVPWTTFARIQVAFFFALSLMLLGVGINTNATVLLSSGISAFSSPIRAYLFSLVPIGIAAAIKVPGSHIELRPRRVGYALSVWAMGLLFGTIWAAMFASTFPGLTQDTASLIQSLTSPTATADSHASNGGFIFVAILAEAFLAAGCWLTIQLIVEKHEPPSRADNPAFKKVQTDLNHWQSRKCENERLAGILAGKLRAIDEARRHFVEGAVADFRAAVKLATNERHLEDFLNR